jgi:hypothetical protein
VHGLLIRCVGKRLVGLSPTKLAEPDSWPPGRGGGEVFLTHRIFPRCQDVFEPADRGGGPGLAGGCPRGKETLFPNAKPSGALRRLFRFRPCGTETNPGGVPGVRERSGPRPSPARPCAPPGPSPGRAAQARGGGRSTPQMGRVVPLGCGSAAIRRPRPLDVPEVIFPSAFRSPGRVRHGGQVAWRTRSGLSHPLLPAAPARR